MYVLLDGLSDTPHDSFKIRHSDSFFLDHAVDLVCQILISDRLVDHLILNLFSFHILHSLSFGIHPALITQIAMQLPLDHRLELHRRYQ